MAIKTETREINGNLWRIQAFPGRKALRVQSRLSRLLGPALGALVSTAGEEGVMNKDISSIPFDKIASLLVDKLDEETVEDTVLLLLSETSINDDPVDGSVFDRHFAANFGELAQGLSAVLEVNFGNFFAALTSSLATEQKER